MKLRHFVPALIFLIIAIGLMLGNDLANKPNFKHDMVGKQIPAFETVLLNSKEKISDKDLVKLLRKMRQR